MRAAGKVMWCAAFWTAAVPWAQSADEAAAASPPVPTATPPPAAAPPPFRIGGSGLNLKPADDLPAPPSGPAANGARPNAAEAAPSDADTAESTAPAPPGTVVLPKIIVREDAFQASDRRFKALTEALPDPGTGGEVLGPGIVESTGRFLLKQLTPQAPKERKDESAEDRAQQYSVQGGCDVGGGAACLTGNNP